MIYTQNDFTINEIIKYCNDRYNKSEDRYFYNFISKHLEEVMDNNLYSYNTITGITKNKKETIASYSYNSDIPVNPTRDEILKDYIAHDIYCACNTLHNLSMM